MKAINNSQFAVETEQIANEKDRLHAFLFAPVIKKKKLHPTYKVINTSQNMEGRWLKYF